MLITAGAFALALAANATTTEMAPRRSPNPDKLICRRDLETGSLVKMRRTCHTKREWEEMGNAARRDAHAIQEKSLIATGR